MSSQQLALIPSYRRDRLFQEIRDRVTEVDAIDRSLNGIGEGMAVDECLEEIVDAVNSEIMLAVRRARPLAVTTQLKVAAS